MLGNNDKVTFGGQLVRNLLETGMYELVNGSNKTVGGHFTHYDPAEPKCKAKQSCLSLFIVSKELLKFVDKLEIDKLLKQTPCRPISKNKLIFTDHFSLFLTFKNLQMKSSKIITEHKYTRWDTNKEGGWEEFKALTTAKAMLDEVVNEVNGDPDDMMIRIENEMNKVKFKAFGKVKNKKQE